MLRGSGVPHPDGGLTEDEAARHKLLKTEARLTQVGTMWMVAGAIEGALFLSFAMGEKLVHGQPAPADTVGGFVLCAALAALRAGQTWQGLRIRNLQPSHFGLVTGLALVGVCAGPCACVSWAVPFLVLGADARQVLTAEHAALRTRTPHMQPHPSRFGPSVLAVVVLTPLLALAVLVVFPWMGPELSAGWNRLGSHFGGR